MDAAAAEAMLTIVDVLIGLVIEVLLFDDGGGGGGGLSGGGGNIPFGTEKRYDDDADVGVPIELCL